jgi:hypothetical protein
LKVILQLFLALSLCFGALSAADLVAMESVKLKKDELKEIVVKYDGREKLLTFRWTLYTNNGLVLFRSYDKIVAQNVLYLRNKNRSFRVKLKPSGYNFYDVPYLLVMFKDFNHKTKEAEFELFLSDDTKRIVLEYKKNKER